MNGGETMMTLFLNVWMDDFGPGDKSVRALGENGLHRQW